MRNDYYHQVGVTGTGLGSSITTSHTAYPYPVADAITHPVYPYYPPLYSDRLDQPPPTEFPMMDGLKATGAVVVHAESGRVEKVCESLPEAERYARQLASRTEDEYLVLRPVKRFAPVPSEIEATDL